MKENISEEQLLASAEQLFQEIMLKSFTTGLRQWLLAVGKKKSSQKDTALSFGVALVRDDQVKRLICKKKAPKDIRDSFLNMVESRLRGDLSEEYDGLIYEYRKYESVMSLVGGKVEKIPKPLRGMVIGDRVYRVFLLADSLAGWQHDSLKDLAKPVIDDQFRHVQELLVIQATILD